MGYVWFCENISIFKRDLYGFVSGNRIDLGLVD